ncbi:complement decay-accelerating factor-like [Sceloporus undulatus]|uniref:complement decay-accelerating factor-like n=1 Tax=Sceloporus undulatus TaxID=8520 RepID=UPI001C4D08E6|nr:complement decay-accelerating factor-like [Sceloporus undulatus]XP_042319676.1 complement decay-accelerating factor-like [Sceloporus undulatus]XP_042319677.1 complement decay-accelerating factor-like [Sceloporus undulatus]
MISRRSPTLFVLFPLLSLIRGDCGPPPKLNNAIPVDKVDGESFHPNQSVTYTCLDGFYNIYGKLDIVTCLPDSHWSFIEEFCERVCRRPPRFKFARAKPEDIKPYSPAKTRVTYVCRPGYDTIPGINSVITCLENYTWTALPVFCEGKSCGDPGKPEHGEVVVPTNLLYLAKVNFICEEGYRLMGLSSIQCMLKGDRVEWQAKPPECQQIICISPPNVTNASHDGKRIGNFTYNSTVMYHCDHGFLMVGEASIRCITEDNLTGVWRASVPECKAIPTFTTPVLLTKEPTEKENNFTGANYSTMLTSPIEQQGLQLGIIIAISILVLVVLTTAVIAVTTLGQKKGILRCERRNKKVSGFMKYGLQVRNSTHFI